MRSAINTSLLNRCESWTSYRHHIELLKQFHQCIRDSILFDIKWQNCKTYNEVLQLTQFPVLSPSLSRDGFGWRQCWANEEHSLTKADIAFWSDPMKRVFAVQALQGELILEPPKVWHQLGELGKKLPLSVYLAFSVNKSWWGIVWNPASDAALWGSHLFLKFQCWKLCLSNPWSQACFKNWSLHPLWNTLELLVISTSSLSFSWYISEKWEQGWFSGVSTRFPPMWPRFESWRWGHLRVEFVMGPRPFSEGFTPVSVVFFHSQKPTLPKSNLTLQRHPN